MIRTWIFIGAAAVVLVLAARISAAAGEGGASLRGIDQAALFRVVGAMYDVDPDLLHAIARVESGGQPNAVSPAGAIGLMQLMPSTAERFEVSDPRDPVENVLGAARFIAHLRASEPCTAASAGTLAELLAAYNAGEGAVCRYDGIPPFTETRNYVGKVLWIYLGGSDSRRPIGAVSAAHHESTEPSRRPRAHELSLLEQLDAIRRARAASAGPTIPPLGEGQR